MRKITFTKMEFDNCVYFAYGNTVSENEAEFEVSYRLGLKLRKVSTEIPNTGTKVPSRELATEEATVLLEEDEYKLLRRRFKAAIPNFAPFADHITYPLKRTLDEAETFDTENNVE